MIAFSFNGDQLLSAAALGFALGAGWHVAAALVAAISARLVKR